MTDLFGEEARSIPNPGAYPALPGTGPDGKTCRNCIHIEATGRTKTYYKCDLIKWTHGSATDIRATAPACERFSDSITPETDK